MGDTGQGRQEENSPMMESINKMQKGTACFKLSSSCFIPLHCLMCTVAQIHYAERLPDATPLGHQKIVLSLDYLRSDKDASKAASFSILQHIIAAGFSSATETTRVSEFL